MTDYSIIMSAQSTSAELLDVCLKGSEGCVGLETIGNGQNTKRQANLFLMPGSPRGNDIVGIGTHPPLPVQLYTACQFSI